MDDSSFEHILVVERADNQEIFILKNEPFSIGRHSSNSLVIKSRFISRCHATILPIKSKHDQVESFWLIDGNEQGLISTNGLTVNNEPYLMHELKSEDKIILPDGTKIIYKIKEKSLLKDLNEPDEKLSVSEEKKKQTINQFKIKTEFSQLSSSYKLDTRIYVQNTMMLYLLLEKELEMVKNRNGNISLIFIYYNLHELQRVSPKSYQKIFRLYQLVINQKVNNISDFILSFKSLEIAVMHGLNQKNVAELADKLAKDIEVTTEKLNLMIEENIIEGAYSQIPQTERNIKVLIEQVSQKLLERSKTNHDFSFLNLNLLKFG